eukprot:CAMPEP_0202967206 /NCGR_PEP_ID=MMETSP1396-20130829/11977_1 /ASSEMBLY_ACC=CAM_ASM_000872 /TAXON_ID= /ORGANISM="Pseudokeronopsis sp., Strain Brazil" /LENGTH=59 /DNA_ID=CAMNT_0049691973 /DNA_START=1708 /DNA_END=1887 /DNA_ORIENTATION=-
MSNENAFSSSHGLPYTDFACNSDEEKQEEIDEGNRKESEVEVEMHISENIDQILENAPI